jgi:membrane protease YdiL (CAAX protease family)
VSPHPAAVIRERRLEVSVFLFLIVPPMIVANFSDGPRDAFVLFATSAMLTDLAFVALALFFLWRNGEPFSRCGLVTRRVGRELLLGVALYPLIAIGLALATALFHRLGLSEPTQNTPTFLAAHGGGQFVLASVLVLVVSCAEEILFRGYLTLRFSELQPSPIIAIISASAIFALGHTYEGTAGLATVFLLGMALGLIRRWRGSLIAPIVIHALQDFVGIVALPLLRE